MDLQGLIARLSPIAAYVPSMSINRQVAVRPSVILETVAYTVIIANKYKLHREITPALAGRGKFNMFKRRYKFNIINATVHVTKQLSRVSVRQ